MHGTGMSFNDLSRFNDEQIIESSTEAFQKGALDDSSVTQFLMDFERSLLISKYWVPRAVGENATA